MVTATRRSPSRVADEAVWEGRFSHTDRSTRQSTPTADCGRRWSTVANELANASSPYLRQHADNPVDWYEWGEEAFEEARRRDVPVFLSVGYASCHWCHVMAHESFEDNEVARVLNDRFVPVKVDREERPDVDRVYMDATQAMTGHGGWPMSVFLTPDGKPFFAGTYWPRDDRQGMPGFLRVLEAVSSAWDEQREQVVESADTVTKHLHAMQDVAGADQVDATVAEQAAKVCVQAWDDRDGGFGRAPKFPQAMTIDFLLAHHLRTGDEGVLQAAAHTLEQMARGGIYDHVGGGFHRYAVDEVWLVPHFEKMLYDNALLLRAYTHGWQVTGNDLFRRVVVETADYLLRDLRHPDGAFFSSTDADSDGIEGAFFVWTLDEFTEVVAAADEDPERWAAFYGVTEQGNFSDPHRPDFGSRTVLNEAGEQPTGPGFEERRRRVLEALRLRREGRTPPGLDDKVLSSWNALVIGALAEAGAALSEPRYIEAAASCAAFIRDRLVVDGQLHHTWTDQHGAAVPAFLEDVAGLAQALLVLYEADHDPSWYAWAGRLAAQAETEFADGDTGVYFSTAHEAEPLITRPRDLWDNATPSGASMMADVHLRLAGFTANHDHLARAERTLAAFQTRAAQVPTGYGELLRALERLVAGTVEVAVVGRPDEDATRALTTVYREAWRPATVLAVGEPSGVGGSEAHDTPTPDTHPVPLLHGRSRVDGRPAAYVCRNFACDRPVTDPGDLRALLGGSAG
jgi:uncharacterized protein